MNSNIDEINSDFYNTCGDVFDKIPFETTLTDMLLKYKIKGEVLEVGAGPGTLAAWMEEHGCKVTCLEPAQEFVKKVLAKGLRVFPLSIQQFQTEQQYDSVIAISSLIHVPKVELPSQIRKIAKFLKPNGMFFVSFIEGETEGLEDPSKMGKMRYFARWSEKELDALLSTYFVLLENTKIFNQRMDRNFILRAYSLKTATL